MKENLPFLFSNFISNQSCSLLCSVPSRRVFVGKCNFDSLLGPCLLFLFGKWQSMQRLFGNHVARNDRTQARRLVVGNHHCAFPILSIQGGSFDCTQ